MKLLTGLLTLGVVLACTANLTAEEEKTGPPTVAGKVKAIDSKAGSITLEGRKKEGGQVSPDQSFTLAKDVKVTAGKDAKTLADVQAGVQVTLTLSEDKKTVTTVALPGPKGKEGDKR
jgi:hypothetical protein